MQRLFRPLIILVLVLLVPFIPFLWFAGAIDAWTARWCAQPHSPLITAAMIVGLLSTDVLLPIPSSLVSTLGGSQLGMAGGTLASWVGLSVGATIGFGLARRWGRPLANRLAKADELERLDGWARRYGTALLVVTRAVPLVAEAAVLLVGIHQLPWRKFWPAVLLSNLGIALAYSVFGHVAQENHWLPAALGLSLALPLLLATVVRWWLPKGDGGS